MKKFLIILSLLVGCKKLDENGFRTYTIKENRHYSTYKYKTTWSNQFEIECIFDSSAIYFTRDSLNQWDINKLWGVSDCGNGHMESSIRFGWRWLNDSLEIHWFKHEFGDFSFDKLASIELGETIAMSLDITNDNYILCVDGNCDSTERSCSQDYKKYFLYPYFGGDEKAPHCITIKIKE